MIQLNLSNLLTLVLLAVGGDADAQPARGGVSGKLITESGLPLANVTAVYRRGQKRIAMPGFHSRPAPGEVAASGSVTTSADGTFAISNLPAGSYSLCLDNPPALYVDHCAWNLSGAIFAVVAGTSTAVKPITIFSGVRIHFLIADPQGLLPTAAQLEPVAHVGVMTPGGIYRPAVVSSRSGGVTELIVTVPHNQPVAASVFSRTLRFANSNGALTAAVPFTAPPGATDYNVPLTVSR